MSLILALASAAAAAAPHAAPAPKISPEEDRFKACVAQIDADPKAALDTARPTIALYVGGMGAKSKNFHKEKMIERGYPEAAERIQELFLAGHKKEAEAAVPDEFLDDMSLVGPKERIAERFKAWRDSRFTHLRVVNVDDESMEYIAKLND